MGTKITYELLVKGVVNYRVEKSDVKHIRTLEKMAMKSFCYAMKNNLPESKKHVIENACKRNAEICGSSFDYELPQIEAIGYENGVEYIMSGVRCSANIYINKNGEITRKKQTGEKTWNLNLDCYANYFNYSTFEYKDGSIDMLDVLSTL